MKNPCRRHVAMFPKAPGTPMAPGCPARGVRRNVHAFAREYRKSRWTLLGGFDGEACEVSSDGQVRACSK